MSESQLPPADDVFVKFFAVADKLRQNVLKASPKRNVAFIESLTMRQQKAMMAVFIMTKDAPEGVSLKKLAKRLDMTVPATSVLVETLVQCKIFLRNPSFTDRRAVCINLSKVGREMFVTMGLRMRAAIEALTGGLNPGDRQGFANVVSQMHAQLFKDEEMGI